MMSLDLILILTVQASTIAASSTRSLDHNTLPCDGRPPAIINLDSKDCNGVSCNAGELCVLGSCVALYSGDSHSKCGDNTTNCRPGQQCNAGDCYPIELLPNPLLCSATSPCNGGEVCSNGTCYPINTGGDSKNCGPKHKRCGPGTTCHRTSCVPLTYGFKDGIVSPSNLICADGRQCEPGSLCVNDKCHTLKMHDQSCKSCSHGTLCYNGECTPIQLSTDLSHCSKNSHCSEDEICISGVCTGGWANPCRDAIVSGQNTRSHKRTDHLSFCRTDTDCSPLFRCDEENHICIPYKRYCNVDDECGKGMSCRDKVCAKLCKNDQTCGFRSKCKHGFCISSCVFNTDCPNGQRCGRRDGICKPEICKSNSQCPFHQKCFKEQCTATCEKTIDCSQGEICYNTRVCGPRRQNACVVDDDCPLGLFCNSQNGCEISQKGNADLQQGCTTTWPGCERPHNLPFDGSEGQNTEVVRGDSGISVTAIKRSELVG